MTSRRLRAYGAAIFSVALLVLVVRTLPWVNDRTATIFLLLVVLIAARVWGFGPGVAAAGCASAAFAYFVLPPDGFTIRDPNDWLAFASFLVAAALAGGMMALAQRSEQQRQQFRDQYWDLLATHKREMARHGLESTHPPGPPSGTQG